MARQHPARLGASIGALSVCLSVAKFLDKLSFLVKGAEGARRSGLGKGNDDGGELQGEYEGNSK